MGKTISSGVKSLRVERAVPNDLFAVAYSNIDYSRHANMYYEKKYCSSRWMKTKIVVASEENQPHTKNIKNREKINRMIQTTIFYLLCNHFGS